MYAEDFYSGGDTFLGPSQGATPSHLTPRDDGELYIPGITPTSEEATPAEVIDVDDFLVEDGKQIPVPAKQDHADTHEAAEFTEVQKVDEGDGPCAEERGPEGEASPSPPSPILSNNVNWNWLPAFPGRRATEWWCRRPPSAWVTWVG